jgi:hypothetical protein
MEKNDEGVRSAPLGLTQLEQVPGEQPSRRASSAETERPPSGQRVNVEGASNPQEKENEDEVEGDPADDIGDFDWDGLAARYHRAMDACQTEDQAIMQEWESLMSVQLPFSDPLGHQW